MYKSACHHLTKLYCWKVPMVNDLLEYICGECGFIIMKENISPAANVVNISNDKMRGQVSDICRIFETNLSGINDYIPKDYEWLSNKNYKIVKRGRKRKVETEQ